MLLQLAVLTGDQPLAAAWPTDKLLKKRLSDCREYAIRYNVYSCRDLKCDSAKFLDGKASVEIVMAGKKR